MVLLFCGTAPHRCAESVSSERKTKMAEKKSNNKKRKNGSQASVALVYFITFAVMLLLVGGISLFVMEKFVLKDTSSTVVESEDTTPKASENTTQLYLLENDRGELEMTMIQRMLPKSKKIVLLPVSKLTASSSGAAIEKVYSVGGGSAVKTEFEELFDLKINNYIVLNHENFENLIDNLATVSYTVPENMYYLDPNSDDVINYEEGLEVSLFGSELRLFLTYPEYEDGPSQNIKACGEIISKVINQGLATSLTVQNLSSTFSTMVKNSDDKDFSLNDFTERTKELITYIADNSDEPANYITATGSWNADNTLFTVDDTFSEQLKNLFEL